MPVLKIEIEVASQNSDTHVLHIDARRHWLALDLSELLAYRTFPLFLRPAQHQGPVQTDGMSAAKIRTEELTTPNVVTELGRQGAP